MSKCSKGTHIVSHGKAIWIRIKKDLILVKVPLLVLVIYLVVTELIFHTVCPSAIVWGKACYGCGLTRAGILVLTGQFEEVAKMHAMIYFWMFLILHGVFFRYILGKRPPFLITFTILISVITMVYYIHRKNLGILPEVSYEGFVFWGKRILEQFINVGYNK